MFHLEPTVTVRTGDSGSEVATQKKEPSPSNFKILDIDLGDHDLFDKAATKLGNAPKVERGDASNGRAQVCYVSSLSSAKPIHLIFEAGEVGDSFYLFIGGATWKGSELCVRSNLVTDTLSVTSGLRLGQAPAQVMAILGKPNVFVGNKMVYSYEVQKITSPKDLDELRQQHPELGDTELRRNYEFYSLVIYIEARFAQSKLSYLAVSKTEAY